MLHVEQTCWNRENMKVSRCFPAYWQYKKIKPETFHYYSHNLHIIQYLTSWNMKYKALIFPICSHINAQDNKGFNSISVSFTMHFLYQISNVSYTASLQSSHLNHRYIPRITGTLNMYITMLNHDDSLKQNHQCTKNIPQTMDVELW
jgi:hypothetical protein